MMDYRSEVTGLSDKDGRFTGIRGPGGDQEEATKQVFARDCPDWRCVDAMHLYQKGNAEIGIVSPRFSHRIGEILK